MMYLVFPFLPLVHFSIIFEEWLGQIYTTPTTKIRELLNNYERRMVFMCKFVLNWNSFWKKKKYRKFETLLVAHATPYYSRSSHRRCSEACNFIKKKTLAQVFSCEFCRISKSTFFTEHLQVTASVILITLSL